MCTGLHVKYQLFPSDFKKTWIFATDFSNNAQLPNFIKFRPVGAELFHADGGTDRQTDKTKLIVAFRSFAKAAKNGVRGNSDLAWKELTEIVCRS
jgi:hypothetical protein